MIMWETFRPKEKGKHSVLMRCEYDQETGYYIVTMKRGEKTKHKKFKAKHEPTEGYMAISDVEKSVKLLNILDKEMRSEK